MAKEVKIDMSNWIQTLVIHRPVEHSMTIEIHGHEFILTPQTEICLTNQHQKKIN